MFWVSADQSWHTSKVTYTREQWVKAASSAVMEAGAGEEEALACLTFARQKR